MQERLCCFKVQRTLDEVVDFNDRIDAFAVKFGGIPLRDVIYRGNIAGGFRLWTGSRGLAVHIRGIPIGEHDGFPIIKKTTLITPVPQYISSRLSPGNSIMMQTSNNKCNVHYMVVSAERRGHSTVDMESFFAVMFNRYLG